MSTLYHYSARFSARICEKCFETLSDTEVSLYRSKEKRCPGKPNIKQSFKELSDKEYKEMGPDLLSKGKTDARGIIEIDIDPNKTDYQGGCIEVVVTFRRLANGNELKRPEHFRIALYSPQWKQVGNGYSQPSNEYVYRTFCKS